jgi:hypothetical protein
VFALYSDRCVADVDGHKCGRHATHADHYPLSRRQQIAAGLDPNDPCNGRPLCEHHHNQHTGRTQGPLAKQRRRE